MFSKTFFLFFSSLFGRIFGGVLLYIGSFRVTLVPTRNEPVYNSGSRDFAKFFQPLNGSNKQAQALTHGRYISFRAVLRLSHWRDPPWFIWIHISAAGEDGRKKDGLFLRECYRKYIRYYICLCAIKAKLTPQVHPNKLLSISIPLTRSVAKTVSARHGYNLVCSFLKKRRRP